MVQAEVRWYSDQVNVTSRSEGGILRHYVVLSCTMQSHTILCIVLHLAMRSVSVTELNDSLLCMVFLWSPTTA